MGPNPKHIPSPRQERAKVIFSRDVVFNETKEHEEVTGNN